MNQLPPQNIDAEESILASCMLYPNSMEIAVDLLSPEDFYRTGHQKIFSSVCALSTKGEKVDLITLSEALQTKNQLDGVGGSVYLAKIIDCAPVVPNMEQYCEILKQLSIKRQLISGFSDLSNQCFDRTVSGVDVLDKAQQLIVTSESNTLSDKPVKAGSVCDDVIDRLVKINQTRSGITGLRTKNDFIDSITGGLQNTDLYILAGRPGMGKTALALDIAKALTEDGVPILFKSLEMPESQLVSRIASKISGVDSNKFRTGGITQTEWDRITDAMDVIEEMPLYIEGPRDCDFDSIRRKIRRAKRDCGIQAVIIDYLTLMNRNGDFKSRNDLLVGSMSKDLKNLACDLDIPVILLCQLNRAVENRSDKRPVLSDLRESGSLEQDADLVCFVYRDEVYNKDDHNPLKGTAELIIAKYRHGPTGFRTMVWEDKTMTFRSMAVQYKDSYHQHKNQDLD